MILFFCDVLNDEVEVLVVEKKKFASVNERLGKARKEENYVPRREGR